MNENNKKNNLSQNLKNNLHRRKVSDLNIKSNIEKQSTNVNEQEVYDEKKHFVRKRARIHFSKNRFVRFFQKIKVFFYKLIGKKHNNVIENKGKNFYYKKNHRKFYPKQPK